MPLWLQALMALGSSFGFGSIVLEVLRRRAARRDRAADGDATIVVKSIDDGATQRAELWAQMEILRGRLEKQEQKSDRIKASLLRMWEYTVQLRAAYEAAVRKLGDEGLKPPVEAPAPPSFEEVFNHEQG